MTILANYPIVQPSLNLDFAHSGGVLDPRVTFSRSTTAPYYDGKTSVLAEQNLLTYSQDFTNAVWVKGFATNTPNTTTAPDGTSTASTLTPDTSSNYHRMVINAGFSIPAGNGVESIYVKANGYSKIALREGNFGAYVAFDVSAGTIVFTSGSTSGTITSVGNSWYRISIANTGQNTQYYEFYVLPTSYVSGSPLTAWTGDGTSGVYIWGAQLEQRSSVTAYTPTTSSTITNYIPTLQTAAANIPRFDWDPISKTPLGLLIEQSCTNLLFQSQTFNNLGVWAVANATLTANANIAPDGTQTVFQLIPSASSAFTNVSQSITAIAQAYTTSWYVKYNGVQFVQILFGGGLSTNYANYDLINGTVTGGTYTSATITPVGNGVYRISTTNNFAATSSGIYLAAIVTGTSARASNYTGNGYSGIYIWGAQLEALAFPTSYIPTTSAQVTRASDNASMTGTNFSSWFNQGQGTVYCESSLFSVSGSSPGIYSFDDGTTSNALNSFYGPNIYANSRVGGANVFTSYSSTLASTPTFYKQSFSYANANYISVFSGGTPITQTSGVVPSGLNRLQIGSYAGGYLNGRMKKLSFYPQALPSNQLQTLTGY